MSYFYGTVSGAAKTTATRRGYRSSGLRTTAASWQGAVRVSLEERNGKDFAVIQLIPWHGRGVTRVLCEVPVDGSEAA